MSKHQREVPLFTMKDGKQVPFCCEKCGRQRVGVMLNIVDKVMLPCECEKGVKP